LNDASIRSTGTVTRDSESVRAKKPVYWKIVVALVIIALIGISAYALAITPTATILTPFFAAGFVACAGFGWFWMGVDAIPGKRKRSRGLLHGWFIVGVVLFVGIILTYVPVVAPLGYALFPAFVLSLAGKLAWTYGYKSRILYCQRCGTYRWFHPMNGNWYCSKHGHKWYDAESATVTMQSKEE